MTSNPQHQGPTQQTKIRVLKTLFCTMAPNILAYLIAPASSSRMKISIYMRLHKKSVKRWEGRSQCPRQRKGGNSMIFLLQEMKRIKITTPMWIGDE